MGNIVRLVTMGFLPPNYTEKDLKLSIIYKLWEYFRIVCVYAEYSLDKLDNIKCRKVGGACNFDVCPVVERALRMYQQAQKYADLYDERNL